MTVLSITAKGQITLKKDLLKQMGVHPGQKLQALVLPNGKLELSPQPPKHDISAIFGMFADYGHPSEEDDGLDSTERDRQAILAQVGALDDRSRS